MRTNILLGIDLGSTGLKAVAFEAGSGQALAAGGGPLPFDALAHGGCERRAGAIREGLAAAITQVVQALGSRAAQVRGIGCTGHGAGLFALDAQGQLLRGIAIGSMDQRGAVRARELTREHGDALFEAVGCKPWSGQPAVLAAELLGEDAVQRGRLRWVMFAKDYLCFLLTGEMSTDASDASTAGLVSLRTGGWSAEALAFSGIHGLSAGNFPPMVASGTVVGQLKASLAHEWGLPAGLPVATSAIDLLASMHAVHATRSGHAVAVLGTWCVNAVVGPAIVPQPAVASVVHFGDAQRRLYMQNTPSGMANLGWLAQALQLPGPQAVIDAAMSVPLGQAPRFLPFIHGGGDPPGASAGFIGLRAEHGAAHMARAVVQATMALHARQLARLGACGVDTTKHVTVLGGGARDARLARMLAGLLGQAVRRSDDESGARGAALYAAMSQGMDENTLPAPIEWIEPARDELGELAQYLARFNELIDAMAPVYALLSPEAAR